MKKTRKETIVKSPKTLANDAQLCLSEPCNDNIIREKAYEIYAERGFTDGYHHDDWLRAENEVNSSKLV
ncbi:MAG: hypothetical protein A2033_12425 [Bacteroidetes bacterium GWA2_31_9]|nr:MAG: hypothetical protein A2033_12425 [Bacteroidetes bacterium GWA2_31_9]